MELIDDEGNLFGRVNVVDALVVLVLLAVVVAGLAVVGVLTGDAEPETRYATIDLGTQSEHVAEQISEGDVMYLEGSSDNLTVTDVYRSAPGGGEDRAGGASVVIRAELNGQLVEDDQRDDRVFQFDGERLHVGQTVTIDTLDYTTEGEVRSVGGEETSLPVNETQLVLETIVPTATADEIAEGDTYRVAGDTVATVETVQTHVASDDQRRVVVGLTARTIDTGSGPTLGSQRVVLGSTIPVRTDAYEITGNVTRRGALDESGEETTVSVTAKIDNVRPEVANGLEAGMTETERGETVATIDAVGSEPASVILESEDGNIYERDHPRNLDLTLELTLEGRETESGLRFHGEPLREGETIVLDFGTVIVTAEVTDLDR
ncbi:DUF4330 family protein [Natronosalvus halobius]|uniref:DUF4330 family protein n=1 Tax=Natronosalvus halobius TaxID=2953746 RepID=UPI0020A0CF94|nr:DUF4330 family protein [Natronosalvus halobius]USZ71507.1 DUF4330 family protein [Natronosalvus halobius]